MLDAPTTDLHSFVAFAHSRLASQPTLTPEECLQLFRSENPTPDSRAADVVAVRQALAAIGGGDVGVSVDEFDRDFRKTKNLSDV